MNRFLRHALLGRGSPYWSTLPYNLNWMLPSTEPVLSDGLSAPIVVADVGSRGGLPAELWPIRHLVHQVGFDADPEEASRANAEAHDLFARSIHPVFVGGADGATEFHLYKVRGESSAYGPDPRFAAQFAGTDFAIDRTIHIEATTLDSFFRQHPELPSPDMIKLDTHGTELEILRGAAGCLRTCSLVEIEVQFRPIFEGSVLFHEIVAFMLEQGFELLYLNRVTQQRKAFQGFARGQLTFGDALFVRRDDRLDHFDEQRFERMLRLLVNYGHLDLAHDLRTARRPAGEGPDTVESYLRVRGRASWRRRVQRRLIPWLDKFLLLLLYLRQHNSLKFDSDRSWPFR